MIKHPYIAYLWCMERIMWYRYRRAWARAMTHARDRKAMAEYSRISDLHNYYLFRLAEVRRDAH